MILEVLYFSRGKGRGHAIPDSAIAASLVEIDPKIDVKFVSYSTGLNTLREQGWETIDLRLPEDSPLWDTSIGILRLLQNRHPTLVVSHEEFCAIPIANAFRVPSVFLTDWFSSPESLLMQSLKYADEVIFLDHAGFYDIPPYLVQNTIFVGPILQCPPEGLKKSEIRAKLKIPAEAALILGAPGGAIFHSETRAPLFDLVLEAYRLLEIPQKRLVWVVDTPDYDLLAKKVGHLTDVLLMKPHRNFLTTMSAADLVITKANRVSVLESEALGIPSISISFGNNPIDDYRVSRIHSNVALRARGLDKVILRNYMATALENASSIKPAARQDSLTRLRSVAERLLMHVYHAKERAMPTKV